MDISQNRGSLMEMLSSAERREQGFRLLMQEYGRRLYWHIRRIVIDHDDAEDALQETCIQVYRKIGQLKDKEQLLPWIYRIATRESLKILRQKRGQLQSIDSVGNQLDMKLTSEMSVDADHTEMLLQRALLQLPTQQRLAFCMRYYDNLSYEEMATITGKRVGTLKANYFYAANKIKAYLKAYVI